MAIAVYAHTPQQSKPVPFQPTNPALVALVDRAITAFPSEESRIRRAAEIVERDGVRVPEANSQSWHIGVYHFYPVTTTCPCPDMVKRGLPCKHLFAKCLYRKLYTPAAPVRSLQFYASLHGKIGGVATVWQDGKIEFVPYDTDTIVSCTIDEIVLGGRKDWIDAAQVARDNT